MQTVPVPANDPLSNALNEEQRTLLDALDGVLAPLADLCLAKGLTIQSIEERLRLSFVQAAVHAHGGLPSSRLASRISASTGLTRREVARLQAEPGTSATRREPRRSPATALVPPVVGLTQAAAEQAIINRGFTPMVEFVDVPFGSDDDGKVTAQDPAANTKLEKGAEVIIRVGREVAATTTTSTTAPATTTSTTAGA